MLVIVKIDLVLDNNYIKHSYQKVLYLNKK